MILTNEKAEKLANYLNTDPERAKALLEMNVEEALAKINADGNDFTVDELQEFAELMVRTSESKSGELDANELESVAGGVIHILPIGFPWWKWRLKIIKDKKK